jgi:hypothetical protein
MKHIRLKKQCLERHNMGHLDPTIVQQQPISVGEKGCSDNTISLQSQQDNILVPDQESNGYTNSCATYASPHYTNMSSNSYYMSPQSINDKKYSASMPASDEVSRAEESLLCDLSSEKNTDSWVPYSSSAELSSSKEEKEDLETLRQRDIV